MLAHTTIFGLLSLLLDTTLSVLHRRLGHTIVRIPLFAYAKSPEGVQLKQLLGEVKSKIEELDKT